MKADKTDDSSNNKVGNAYCSCQNGCCQIITPAEYQWCSKVILGLREDISESKINKVLRILMLHPDIGDEAVNASGRFKDLNHKFRQGMISYGDYSIVLNQIRFQCLEMIKEIESSSDKLTPDLGFQVQVSFSYTCTISYSRLL